MGILNVTPDSFSDGGQHDGFEEALAHACLMASEGVLREIKRRRHYEKPSIKSKRKLREAERRRKRRARKVRQIRE